MSSTIHLPTQRLSLIALLYALSETVGMILLAAYSREDDIEPFGL